MTDIKPAEEFNGITTKHPMYTLGSTPSLPRNPVQATALLLSTIPSNAVPINNQLSYGRKAIPNLVADLSTTQLVRQQKALISLNELFHSPENISQGISENIIHHLVGFLPSENITCRQKASEALSTISNHAIGRNAILASPMNMEKLARNLNDSSDIVRKNIHETLANITTQHEGVAQLLESKNFERLIKRLTGERLDVQVNILTTCYNCISKGDALYMPSIAIASNALDVFSNVAKASPVVEVQVATCQCIMALCFYHDCKRLACNSEVIATLISLLGNSKSSVRAAAAGALMSISIDCDAKRILVRENVVRILSRLLDDDNELVQLNSIKAITNCAEDYRGRFQLHQSLDKLKSLARESPHQFVAVAAKQAIDVITWRP
ncbi:Radial spoke head 14 [Boothiomyces sp. JEL0838]|nr:Radial spoke head 14 [Boothiomyces sp. JEL0838]